VRYVSYNSMLNLLCLLALLSAAEYVDMRTARADAAVDRFLVPDPRRHQPPACDYAFNDMELQK
jgi:hypothetical protein